MVSFLEYEALKVSLLGIRDRRDQAILSTLYACGGRQGELIKLKRGAFRTEVLGKVKTLFIEVPTLKNPEHPRRDFPVNCSEQELVFGGRFLPAEKWLSDIIIDWVKQIPKLESDKFVFPFSTRLIRKVSRKHFGVNAHSFRHSRIRHLQSWGWDVIGFQKMFGWKSIASASPYTYLDASNLIRLMQPKGN